MDEKLYTVQIGRPGTPGARTEQMTMSCFLRVKSGRDQVLQDIKDRGIPLTEDMIALMETVIVEDEQ